MANTYGNNSKNKKQLVTKPTKKYSDAEIQKYAKDNKQFLAQNNITIVKNPRSVSGWEFRKNGKKISENYEDIGKGYYKNETGGLNGYSGKKVTVNGETYETTKDRNQLKNTKTGKLVSKQTIVQKGTPKEQSKAYDDVTKAQHTRVRDFTNRVKTNSNTSTNPAQKHLVKKVKLSDDSIQEVKTSQGTIYVKGNNQVDKNGKVIKTLRSKDWKDSKDQKTITDAISKSKTKSIETTYGKTTTGGYADRTRNSNTGRVATWNQPSADAVNTLNIPGNNNYYNATDLNANINRGTFRNSQLKEQGVSFQDAWNQARAAGALQFRYGNGMYNTRQSGESTAAWLANANKLYNNNLVANQDNQYIAADATRNANGTVTRNDTVASYGQGRGQYNDNQFIGGYDNRQMHENTDVPEYLGEITQTGKTARFGYSTGASPEFKQLYGTQDRLIGRDVAANNGILSSQIRDLPYITPFDNALPGFEVVAPRKHQAGGQIQQQQLIQQIAQLIQQGGPEQAVQALMAQGASQEQATQLVQQVMQAMGGTPSARQGAKLNYLKSLQGICAADEYLTYFKAGGSICPVCAKKKQIQEAKCGKKLQKGGGVSKAVDDIKSQLRSKR